VFIVTSIGLSYKFVGILIYILPSVLIITQSVLQIKLIDYFMVLHKLRIIVDVGIQCLAYEYVPDMCNQRTG
jgi:hypothetical protein